MGMLYRLISRFCVLLYYLRILSNFAHTGHYLKVIQTTLLILALKSYINETSAHNSTLRCRLPCGHQRTWSKSSRRYLHRKHLLSIFLLPWVCMCTAVANKLNWSLAVVTRKCRGTWRSGRGLVTASLPSRTLPVPSLFV